MARRRILMIGFFLSRIVEHRGNLGTTKRREYRIRMVRIHHWVPLRTVHGDTVLKQKQGIGNVGTFEFHTVHVASKASSVGKLVQSNR